MSSSQKEPLITRPNDTIIDVSELLDKSTTTEGFPYPVYLKPKKKSHKECCAIICCVLSIVSTSLMIWASFGRNH
jgi:hypothetical protein